MTSYYKPEKFGTKDGSDTLVHSELGELYHSRHGALTESIHVFIENGLKSYLTQHPDRETVRILEMGFGTGLNAVLSFEIANHYQTAVEYCAIERYPVAHSVIREMQFPGLSGESIRTLQDLHAAPWGNPEKFGPYFGLEKIQGSFLEHNRFQTYDLIYYDAFAPDAQPELWDETALGLCSRLLNHQGTWVSYCAKGSVKRTLKKAGFEVTALPGPPFKREMTRAVKIASQTKTNG